MFDVVALGELLIDFTYQGRSENGMRLFEQNPGGAPANMLCAASNLGLRTAFIGKVGRDMHGDYLRRVLEEKGVDTGGLVSDPEVFTTLAFVELSETGERNFSFARRPGADTCLLASEVNRELTGGCRIFHFGSLSLTDEPSRTATIEAVKLAKKAGAIISYDPNYRQRLACCHRRLSVSAGGLLRCCHPRQQRRLYGGEGQSGSGSCCRRSGGGHNRGGGRLLGRFFISAGKERASPCRAQ